eukprot:gene9124-biopygen1256
MISISSSTAASTIIGSITLTVLTIPDLQTLRHAVNAPQLIATIYTTTSATATLCVVFCHCRLVCLANHESVIGSSPSVALSVTWTYRLPILSLASCAFWLFLCTSRVLLFCTRGVSHLSTVWRDAGTFLPGKIAAAETQCTMLCTRALANLFFIWR